MSEAASSSSPRHSLAARRRPDSPWKRKYEQSRNSTSNSSPMNRSIDPSIAHSSSTDDSIIRRVEEEIAAARKAAFASNDDRQIMHTNSSSSESSKNRALEMIRDEFQTEVQKTDKPNDNTETLTNSKDETVELVIHSKPDIYFTDEEWQVPSDEEKTSTDSAVENKPKSTTKRLQLFKSFQQTPSQAASPQQPRSPKQEDREVSPTSNQHHSPTATSPRSTTSPTSRTLSRSTQQAPSPLSPSRAQQDPDGSYSQDDPTPPKGMVRTRELLDTLKEQRQSIVTPKRANQHHHHHAPQSSPKNYTFTRANRARERVKSASRTTRASPTHRETMPRSPRDDESTSSRRSVADPNTRRIRFRNPFPVLKPPQELKSIAALIQDHSTGVPEAPIRWVKPKKELKQLIVAAMGTSLPRRSNACGALKVLTRQKKNQLALVRTDGFLSALIFAASQSLLDTDRNLAIDSRTRAVTCLQNVCTPKDNRLLILNHPGVVECLVKVIRTDLGEGRAIGAASLALLAKTPVCREGLAQVEGLVDVLAKVLLGKMDVEHEKPETSSQYHDGNISGISTRSSTVVDTEDEHDEEEDEDDADEEEEDDDDNGENSGVSVSSTLDDEPPSEISAKAARPITSIRSQNDNKKEEFAEQARANACATLLHLSKQCALSHQLSTNEHVLMSVHSVAQETSKPIHARCLEILCNLTRFPANNHVLTRYEGLVDTMVSASNSASAENRLNALRCLQNMSAYPASKALLATTAVLNLMTSCAMRKDVQEKQVAVATIYNITTEPSAVTAITNTKNVVATLVHLAHSPDSTSDVRLLACEALATISLWLQTLAGTGKVPEGVTNVPLPSQKTTGWERWD